MLDAANANADSSRTALRMEALQDHGITPPFDERVSILSRIASQLRTRWTHGRYTGDTSQRPHHAYRPHTHPRPLLALVYARAFLLIFQRMDSMLADYLNHRDLSLIQWRARKTGLRYLIEHHISPEPCLDTCAARSRSLSGEPLFVCITSKVMDPWIVPLVVTHRAAQCDQILTTTLSASEFGWPALLEMNSRARKIQALAAHGVMAPIDPRQMHIDLKQCVQERALNGHCTRPHGDATSTQTLAPTVPSRRTFSSDAALKTLYANDAAMRAAKLQTKGIDVTGANAQSVDLALRTHLSEEELEALEAAIHAGHVKALAERGVPAAVDHAVLAQLLQLHLTLQARDTKPHLSRAGESDPAPTHQFGVMCVHALRRSASNCSMRNGLRRSTSRYRTTSHYPLTTRSFERCWLSASRRTTTTQSSNQCSTRRWPCSPTMASRSRTFLSSLDSIRPEMIRTVTVRLLGQPEAGGIPSWFAYVSSPCFVCRCPLTRSV